MQLRVKLWGPNELKGAKALPLKMINWSFCPKIKFSYNGILLQLAKYVECWPNISPMVCLPWWICIHFWKCASFPYFVWKMFEISSHIIICSLLHGSIYCKLKFYFVHHLHCTNFTCGKRVLLKFIHIKNSNTLMENFNYTFLK